ncbi:hypothetical protein HOK51_00420 [Candidatus Woesearchaeota archaeon]|jgi:hypothetical protein|nr:hypothetical protein [Candidatus Woesearchaeota archaeon]MBT6518277.1 hypothetical protein [Candidatus Woesearchaeota archaeon]MBT7367060.1 hypothetical protein [Candidatus Woesearchaeota archaeon]
MNWKDIEHTQIKDEQNKTWEVIGRPSYMGKHRDKIIKEYNQTHGQGNWKLGHFWEGQILDKKLTYQVYEDGYYEFLKNNSDLVEWMTKKYKDCWDNELSNLESGLDYSHQESNATHLQDISVRRVLLRIGKQFQGEDLLQIRSKSTEGYMLSPGRVPFHQPEQILKPNIEWWWKKDSIEDFYQSNKLLLKRVYD